MSHFTYKSQESDVRSIVEITFEGEVTITSEDYSENVFTIEELETILQEAKTRRASWLEYVESQQ